MSTGRNLFASLAELIFPQLCLICSVPVKTRGELSFCPECVSGITFLSGPLCSCCGRPFDKAGGGDHLCGRCLTGKWYFESARGLVLYKEPVANIIHRFKYQGQTVSLKTFRSLFYQVISSPELIDPELVIPVPLHPDKLKNRGFNQAALIARKFYGKKLVRTDLLERVRNTKPQTGLSGKERRRNLKKAFLVNNTFPVRDKKVVLVDDVFTTGTTVNECARTLKRGGAKRVDVLTLARVAD